MFDENPSWGKERIANELFLKLDVRVSPGTVNHHVVAVQPVGRQRGLEFSTHQCLRRGEVGLGQANLRPGRRDVALIAIAERQIPLYAA